MTGYLQRLAASVGSRPSRIRPVVAPFYAGGRFGAEAAPATFALEEESVLVASPARPEPAAPRPALAAIDPSRDRGERNAAAVEPPRAEDVSALEDVVPRNPRAGGQTPTRPATPQSAAHEPAPRPMEFIVETRVAPGIERAPPLVAQRAARPEGDRLRAEASQRSVPGRAPAATPDEIRITIGRVEVIAAPPPQPRAAAPANKATSLEDYLRGVSARRR